MTTPRSASHLRDDALAIWHAGVEAVQADRLVMDNLRVENAALVFDDESLPLTDIDRIFVVGTGKAGAGMAAGVEAALGETVLREKQVVGWLNVPEDCVRPMRHIHLHGARPAGKNEPTSAGVEGAEAILKLVGSAGPRDLCLCLISGGGSALLPAPVPGISLADKQAITRHLSAAGANIRQLNTVRKQLSRIKGGGLARASRAGRLWTLIISDVLGDPLDIIASGPTVPDSSTPRDAWEILRQFGAEREGIGAVACEYLRRRTESGAHPNDNTAFDRVTNLVIGNNAVAVDGAGIEAVRRGYSPAMLSAKELEGAAEEVGRHIAEMAWRMRTESGPDCLITGGEPTVTLAPAEIRGRGGRNQQLVLAALEHLAFRIRNDHGDTSSALDDRQRQMLVDLFRDVVILSGGTDGEDGPTDAAGALVDAEICAAAVRGELNFADFLRRNDAYSFFSHCDGLIKTGPTHTNVCDLRVAVVSRVACGLQNR